MKPNKQVQTLLAHLALLARPPHDVRIPRGYLGERRYREMQDWEVAVEMLAYEWGVEEQRLRERRVMEQPEHRHRLPPSWRAALEAYEARSAGDGRSKMEDGRNQPP